MGLSDGSPRIEGASDGTEIGNTGDSLKVIVTNSSLTVAGTVAVTQSGAWSVSVSNLPSALVGGRLDVNIGAWLGSTAPTVGQKAMAASIPIVISSDQSAVPVSQSGTWTVQPGNTANTTAWYVKRDTEGTVAAGTAATKSDLIGGVFNTALPTLTNGQQAAIQLDSSARIIIRPLTSGTDSVAAVQSGTWNINNISGTVSLPTGASTLAEQQTQTTSLQLLDDTVHAANAAFNKALAIGGQLDDTSPTAATENNVSVARITAQRALHVNLRDNGGTQVGDITTPLIVLDKFQAGYVSGSVSVSTSAVEAKVGGSRVAARKYLYIENTGTTDIFYGPSGVTNTGSSVGALLRRRQFVFLNVGDIGVYVISSASGGTVTVQEMS